MRHQSDTSNIIHGFVRFSKHRSRTVRLRGLRRCVQGDPRRSKGLHQTSACVHSGWSTKGREGASPTPPPSLSPRTNETQAFCREAIMWKHLTHPNIVSLLGVTPTPFQLVSNWMSGGDLPEYIKNNSDADLLGLVGVHSVLLITCSLALLAFRCR